MRRSLLRSLLKLSELHCRAKSSYAHGTCNIPLKFETIGQLLRNQAEKLGSNEFIYFPSENVRKSYENVFNEASKIASGLVALGLKSHDRIGIWSSNRYEWILTQYAASLAGLILVNINPAYKLMELEYCLNKVQINCLVATESFKDSNYYDMLFNLCPELSTCSAGNLHSRRVPSLKHLVILGDTNDSGTWNLNDILAAGDSMSDNQILDNFESVQPDDPCNIQFTSGTSGTPKGACLSHHNIVNNSFFVGLRCGYDRQTPVICCPPPLYHCFGCVFGSLSALSFGGKVVFPSSWFNAKSSLDAASSEKCNSMYGTPTMFIDMLNHPDFDKYDLSELRTGIMAGAPCPKTICQQVQNKMNMKDFTIVYGQTENSPATFQTYGSDSEARRISTVGRVHDHIETKIVDENKKTVSCGTPGELLVRGYCVMLEYYNDTEKTNEVIWKDRWYHTGDLGVMDEEGYLKIVGRMKDMIVRGGENVYPTEIESVLYTHAKVEDVQVIGVPDQRLGEEICAWIRLHHNETATVEEMQTFCRENMARYKMPKYFQFKTESQFPVTVTGKVQKYKMREISTVELGLEHVASHFS